MNVGSDKSLVRLEQASAHVYKQAMYITGGIGGILLAVRYEFPIMKKNIFHKSLYDLLFLPFNIYFRLMFGSLAVFSSVAQKLEDVWDQMT